MRGIEVGEEDVRQAEMMASGHVEKIAKIEDEALARVLKSIPLELLPALARFLSTHTEQPRAN